MRIRLVVVATLLMAVVAAGGLAGTSSAAPRTGSGDPVGSTPAAAGDPATPGIPARYLKQKLRWRMCSFDTLLRRSIPKAHHTRCTTLKVPMDWQHPNAHPDIRIALAYSKASGPRSLGLLTANLGGPGEGGLDTSASLARRNPSLMARYDLLGFDPRGYGASTRVRCRTTAAKLQALPTTPDPRVRSAQTHRAEVARAQLHAAACSASTFSRFVSTQQTVYDVNFLRAFLNKRIANRAGRYGKLNYLGYSSGTWLGAWFADTYPRRVGRFVLDSNLDWTAATDVNRQLSAAAFQRRRDAMFYPWVTRRHTEHGYGATVQAVARHYEENRAALVRLFEEGYDVPRPEEMDHLIADLLRRNSDFPDALAYLLRLDEVVTWTDAAPAEHAKRTVPRGQDLAATALRRSVRSHLAGAALRPAPALPPDAVTTGRALARTVTVDVDGEIAGCNDSAVARDVADVLGRTDAAAARYRFLGYANGVSMCAFWPYPPTPRTIDLTGVPTMLMLQSEGDPVTAYEGAAAAHEVGHTRLVSVNDEGQHLLYAGGPSACARRVADAYVFSGRLPARDRTCDTRPLPGDRTVYALDGPVTG